MNKPSLKLTYTRLCIHTYSTWASFKWAHMKYRFRPFVCRSRNFVSQLTLWLHSDFIRAHLKITRAHFNVLIIFHYTAIKVGLLVLQPRCIYIYIYIHIYIQEVQSHRANHTHCVSFLILFCRVLQIPEPDRQKEQMFSCRILLWGLDCHRNLRG